MRDVLSIFRKGVISLSLLGAVTMVAPLAQAQQNSAVRGGLAGLVTDQVGAVVPHAKVTITGPQGTINTTTDASGKYEATGLTPGLYTLTVTAPGFATFSSKNNEVVIDHTQTLNAKLSLGEVGTTITVEGGVTQIDTENTSVNTAITDSFYSVVPLPRNVSGTFYVAPGVVSGGGTGQANPSIGGASGLENLYVADGVTITDQAYGGLGVYTPSYGSLGTGINLSFVKEVDIKTGAFEPKYGQADGGIVEIVTKSGSNHYHGALNFYAGPGWASAFQRQLYLTPYVATSPTSVLATNNFEASAEVGGYVPGFRDKLFFFGAFDPTLNRDVRIAYPNPGTTLYNQGAYNYNTSSSNWAAKLTYLPFTSTIFEFSSYGDPSRRNNVPSTLATTNALGVSSAYQYGTRNSVGRVNTTIFPWLTGFAAYAYNHASFSETPAFNAPQVSNRVITPFVTNDFGGYYKTKDNNYQIQGELSARSSFFGKHVTSIGYLYDHLDFGNSTLRSGNGFVIPSTNWNGDQIATLYPTSAKAIGQTSNVIYRMFRADGYSDGTKHPQGNNVGCTYCALYRDTTGQVSQIYLQVYRGTYKGSVVSATGRYHAAYGNEQWTFNKNLTINAGLRWEQQAYGGSLLTYHWRDNWSPRVGATYDPFGDRKTAIKFTWSRYSVPLPLDAAVRQLGNEQDDTSFFFAPQKDSNGFAVTDAGGAVMADTSKALNGTPRCTSTALYNNDPNNPLCNAGATFGAPSFASSTGEGIIPGTKMEFQDEFILSASREVRPGTVMTIRYTDRQYKRIVEDIGSQSPEGSLVVPNYAGGIANVNASTDLFVNENEVTYTPAQFTAANGAGSNPGNVTPATYKAPVAGCTYANDVAVANGGYFTHYDKTPYNGGCIANLSTADNLGSDGKPDGFADPRRHYQAFEVEMVRSLRNHWQGRINYRYAKLYGNYEGFFRNDNGQSDPGISSLFDFTQGAIGLLGDQFKRGYLNSDRSNVANVLLAYTVDKSSRFIGKMNGLTVGTYFHALSGTPLSAFQSHPIYLDPGEVPVGGRGTLGRTPVAFQLDGHLEQRVKLGEKYAIKGAFDGFNILNSQPVLAKNQNLDTSPGVANPDYNKPGASTTSSAGAYQQSFRARFQLGFEF